MAQDKTAYNDPELNRQVILAAINSLDMSKITTEEDLARQTTRRANTIHRMLMDSSIESRALASVRIRANVSRVEFEESSQRYVIHFKATRGDDQGEETIRTPRMDTFDGRVIKPIVDKLIDRVAQGDSAGAVLYKFNEPAPENAKGPQVPSHGYRTCCWLDLL